jgi:hypothetical protein
MELVMQLKLAAEDWLLKLLAISPLHTPSCLYQIQAKFQDQGGQAPTHVVHKVTRFKLGSHMDQAISCSLVD